VYLSASEKPGTKKSVSKGFRIRNQYLYCSLLIFRGISFYLCFNMAIVRSERAMQE
jgi:hypothetical protein